MELSVQEIMLATNALNLKTNNDQRIITGVSFDTRKIKKGDLFIPLLGNRDGHDFVNEAITKGAKAFFWAKDLKLAPQVPKIFIIQVEDTLIAMQKLAKYYLNKINPLRIAITGSNGKTTTKDLAFATLSTLGNVFKTQGNYNNEIGVPYTILQMPKTTKTLIVEMGMDHFGDLHLLSSIVEPNYAVITMIGESHLEFLQTKARIAEGKMQIADFLADGGELIVPDEPLLEQYLADFKGKVTKIGLKGENVDVTAAIIHGDRYKSIFKTSFSNESFEVNLPGIYNVRNALIATYLAFRFKIESRQIKSNLKNAKLSANRSLWYVRRDGLQILIDAYNANPTAMKLVLKTFAKTKLKNNGRRIAVLADMLELGEQSVKLHQSLLPYLDFDQIQKVYLYGERMWDLAQLLEQIYPIGAVHFYQKNSETDEHFKLICDLKKEVKRHDLVMLKGSNSMNLVQVAKELMVEEKNA